MAIVAARASRARNLICNRRMTSGVTQGQRIKETDRRYVSRKKRLMSYLTWCCIAQTSAEQHHWSLLSVSANWNWRPASRWIVCPSRSRRVSVHWHPPSVQTASKQTRYWLVPNDSARERNKKSTLHSLTWQDANKPMKSLVNFVEFVVPGKPEKNEEQ